MIKLGTLIILGTILSTSASANTVKWQATAMSCTPSHRTVEEQKYETTAGRVKFKPNAIGAIVFICPVTHPIPEGNYGLRGRIRTPIPDRFGITIQLRKADNVSGAVETLLSVAGVQAGNVAGFRHTDSPLKRINFDMSQNTYWVQISYTRNSAQSDSLSILSAQLIRVP